MAGKFVGSKFVVTDPDDPEAPRVLVEYVTNPAGHLLTPGLVVTYVNPAMPGLGNPTPGGGPMVLAELILYPDEERPYVEGILDGGKYSCSADNLVPVEAVLSDAAVEAEAEADAAGQRGAVAAALAEALGTEPAHVADALRAAEALGVRPLESPGASPQPVARDNAEAPGAEGWPDPEACTPAAMERLDHAIREQAEGELPGEWPDLSACTAAAFAAYEAIQGGGWDPYLPILAGAIAARRRMMAAAAVEAVKAAGGDPGDPDDPAWAEVDRAWRPPRRGEYAGPCSVCGEGHRVTRSGLVQQHGPRGEECTGSGLPPGPRP